MIRKRLAESFLNTSSSFSWNRLLRRNHFINCVNGILNLHEIPGTALRALNAFTVENILCFNLEPL